MAIIGDEDKLRELILHISRKCASDPRFGSTKLNKLLYFCDFWAFGRWGRPITAVDYQHIENGPAPRRLKPVRRQMVEDGDLAIQEVPLKSGNTQTRTIALRKPKLADFTAEEIALVDEVIDLFWNSDSDGMTHQSHADVGWKMTEMYETIPYGSIFLSDAPLTDAEIFRGQELARKFGWVA